MRHLFRLVAAAVAVAGSITLTQQASAQTAACTTPGYTSAYSTCSSNSNKSATQVVAAETLRAATVQTADLLSQRISSFTTAGVGKMAAKPFKGLSGGSEELGVGMWLNAGYSRIDYNRAASEFKGDVWTGMGGVDYKVTSKLLAGVAVGYEYVDLDTTFNRGEFEGKGWTVAPYGLYRFTDNYSVDLSVGYSWIDYSMFRLDPVVSTRINGDTNGERYFGIANLNGNWAQDAWRFGSRLGVMYSTEEKDAYTESNGVQQDSITTRYFQGNVGGQVGYHLGIAEPYARGTYRYEFQNGNSPDDDDFLVGLGSYFYIGEVAIGGIEVSTPLGREDLNQYNVNANIRFKF